MAWNTMSRLLGLGAAGCLLAVGAAQAQASGVRPEIRLFSTDNKPIHRDIGVYRYVHPDHTQFPVTDTSSGKLHQLVFIDGWALVDETNCLQLGTPGLFSLPDEEREGTWSNGIISAPLGSGACPGVNFNFSSISFRWHEKRSPRGSIEIETMTSVITGIPKIYGLGSTVKLVDTVTFKYKGE